MVAVSWSNVAPVVEEIKIDREISVAALEIESIQNKIARDLSDPRYSDGSICVIELDFPEKVRYVGLGVDPDPRNCGNIDGEWLILNSTIVYALENGAKKKIFLKTDDVQFRPGFLNKNGEWVLDSDGSSRNHDMGVVIENPSGKYYFELVFTNRTYTMARF